MRKPTIATVLALPKCQSSYFKLAQSPLRWNSSAQISNLVGRGPCQRPPAVRSTEPRGRSRHVREGIGKRGAVLHQILHQLPPAQPGGHICFISLFLLFFSQLWREKQRGRGRGGGSEGGREGGGGRHHTEDDCSQGSLLMHCLQCDALRPLCSKKPQGKELREILLALQ